MSALGWVLILTINDVLLLMVLYGAVRCAAARLLDGPVRVSPDHNGEPKTPSGYADTPEPAETNGGTLPVWLVYSDYGARGLSFHGVLRHPPTKDTVEPVLSVMGVTNLVGYSHSGFIRLDLGVLQPPISAYNGEQFTVKAPPARPVDGDDIIPWQEHE
jgi:hypothetical protein